MIQFLIKLLIQIINNQYLLKNGNFSFQNMHGISGLHDNVQHFKTLIDARNVSIKLKTKKISF